MPQKIQDINLNKKSIRLIKKDRGGGIEISTKTQSSKIPTYKKEKVSKNSHIFLWILSTVCVIVLFFLLTSTFSSASITITPKKQNITLDDTYSIYLKPETTGLHFQVMNITQTLSKSLEATGEEQVEKKATGKAILYNNFSTTKQRLINNTRLEANNGLIYRIRQSIDVPGYKIVGGKKIPGSIEVDIIADATGEKYNMKLSDFQGDFKIPGLKGSPRYDSFYGRLSSDITGGFVGMVKKVPEETLNTKRTELKQELTDKLIKDMYFKLPEQYIVLKNNYFIEITDKQDVSTEKDYQISKEATIHAIIFNKDELSSYLAKQKIKDFDESRVEILSTNNATTSISGTTNKPWNENILRANFKGTVDLVWVYDVKEILGLIAGQKKNVIQEIINSKFQNVIEKVQVSIRPQWNSSFPKNPSRIKFFDSVREVEMK